MQCPSCNSDMTQRLEVIYETGTQDISTTSYTAAGGALSANAARLGLGGAATSTSGLSMTKLAQKLAPPAQRRLKWPLIVLTPGLIVLFAVFSGGGGNKGFISGIFSGLLLASPGAIWLYLNMNFNMRQWPVLFRDWQEHWYCNKCGAIFKPE